jgi:hypothetical protein
MLGEWSEGGLVGAVEVVAAAFVHSDESCVAQNAKVLRHCSERDIGVGGDLAG